MRQLSFDYSISLRFTCPVARHTFLLRCIPPSFPSQRILDVTLALSPCVPYSVQRDAFGNLLQTGCIEDAHEAFSYSVRGTAQIDTQARAAEPLHPMYRYPSACTRADGALRAFAQSLPLAGPPTGQAMQIAQAVHEALAYTPGVTDVKTTAAQAFALKKGVCQDFAHIFITAARMRGIPARYANGLPMGEGASHAWAEIYDGGRWVGVDPTRNRLVGDDYVRFCVGRDFDDCAIERGVFLGVASQAQTVRVRVEEQ